MDNEKCKDFIWLYNFVTHLDLISHQIPIKVNGKNVKPSYDVKLNDEIELYLGRHHLIVKVTNIREFANKDQAESMFEVLKDEIVNL